MATITTNTYLDESPRTAAESWQINGGILTIRTDTRWHANSPAGMAGTLGTCTISATLGGGIFIDATKVREVQFNSGVGTVPSVGTIITQGDTSGYLLGVWPDLASAPAEVGSEMPLTGFIKFRELDGSLNAGTLVGIGANCTQEDTTSWIEIVQQQSRTNNIPRLGYYKTEGNWYVLPQITNGIPGQIIQIPTNGGGIGTHVPGIWIETGINTNEYEMYQAIPSRLFVSTNLGTDERCKFVETIGNGQIRIGNNGTDDIGFLPIAGCRIRIPNILGRQSSSTDESLNLEPHSTMGTRPDFTVTSGGDISFNFFMNDWYNEFSSAYAVEVKNCAMFDAIAFTNIASPTVLDNTMISIYTGAAIPFALLNNPFGGVITDCKFIKGAALSNADVCTITLSSDYTFNNVSFGVIPYNRTTTSYSLDISQCNNIIMNNIYQCNTSMRLTTCLDVNITNIDHCDRYVGNTNSTSGIYCISVTTSSNNIKVDGLTFGLNNTVSDYCNPYLSPFYVINSSNVTFRNAGTKTNPLSVNPNAASQYCVHEAGVNVNIKFQRIYLTNTRTSTYVTLNTSKNVTIENVYGSVGSLQTLALNALVRGVKSATYSITGGTSVYGTHFFDMFTSDTSGIIWFGMNESTEFSQQYVDASYIVGGFTSTGIISLPLINDSIIMEFPYFILGHTGFDVICPIVTGTNIDNFKYEYMIDNGNEFPLEYSNLLKVKTRQSNGISGTNFISVYEKNSPMPEIGDILLAPLGTQYLPGTVVTDVSNNIITFNNNFVQNLTGSIYFIKQIIDESVQPDKGFKLKIKITTTDENTTNAIKYIDLKTTSTEDAQTNNLYPLDYSTISLSGIIPNSRVRLYDVDNATELYNDIVTENRFEFLAPYTNDYICNIRIMYQDSSIAYILEEFNDVVTINGLSRTINQSLDEIYNTNGIDGSIVSDIVINYAENRIELINSTTWQNIYARRTYRLYQENGIREKTSESFLIAIDSVNYKLRNLKLINVSNPSIPISLTGGWAVDYETNKSIDIIDTSGGTIFNMPDHVVAFSTGGSSLTPTESAQLLLINSNLEIINRGIKNSSLLIPHTEDL